jgi:phytoene desaturase
LTARVGVVGGGLGGLAAAVTLAARGYDVVLCEQSTWLGGKAAVLREGGFRFDMGPTILTVPSVLARIFSEANRRLEDELDLIPLEPQWRCFFSDRTTLDLVSNAQSMKERLHAFAPGWAVAADYERFLNYSKKLHEISKRYFFWRSIGSMADMFDWKSSLQPGLLADVLKLRLGRSVAQTVRSMVPEPRVAQMLDHFTQYIGSSPEQSPAVLCGIAHMQTSEGVWYPRGGTRAIPQALANLATSLGVEIRVATGIQSLALEGRRVIGMRAESGELIDVDAVVSNADSVRTHRELVGGKAGKKFDRRRRYEPACSGVVLYLGLNRRFEHLAHHNFVFSADPHEEFDFIYRQGEPAPDPTCYVCTPARTDPDVAPPGGEALYVLVHTPYLRDHHDWNAMFPDYRKRIIEKLKETAGLSALEDSIRVERWLTPKDIHERYRVLNGAIYGLASHGKFTGAFKPSNRSPDVDGLYVAGGSAHPGPGMPMALMSGWIAADALDSDRKAGRLPLSGGRGHARGGEFDSNVVRFPGVPT